MITTKKEARYHIFHSEEQYERGEFNKDTLEVKLQYFIEILASFDYEDAEEQITRVNKKYDFSLSL